jgi:hypothetical protein
VGGPGEGELGDDRHVWVVISRGFEGDLAAGIRLSAAPKIKVSKTLPTPTIVVGVIYQQRVENMLMHIDHWGFTPAPLANVPKMADVV